MYVHVYSCVPNQGKGIREGGGGGGGWNGGKEEGEGREQRRREGWMGKVASFQGFTCMRAHNQTDQKCMKSLGDFHTGMCTTLIGVTIDSVYRSSAHAPITFLRAPKKAVSN